MKGIGIDLCEVARIEKSLDKFGSSFEDRILTDNEKKEANGQVSSIAARWAAKEAFAKAIRTGIRDFNFKDVEIIKDPLGAPSIQLHAGALELFEKRGGGQLHLSITHEKSMAAAVVVWE